MDDDSRRSDHPPINPTKKVYDSSKRSESPPTEPPQKENDDSTRAENPPRKHLPKVHDDSTREVSPPKEPTRNEEDDSTRAGIPPKEPPPKVHDDSTRAESPPREPTPEVHDNSTRAESLPKEPTSEVHDDSTRVECPPNEPTPKVHDDSTQAECPPNEPPPKVNDDSTRAENPPREPTPEVHDDSTRAESLPKEPTSEVHDDSTRVECSPYERPSEVHDDSTRVESAPKEPTSKVHDDSTRVECPQKEPPPEVHDDSTRRRAESAPKEPPPEVHDDSMRAKSPPKEPSPEVPENSTRAECPPKEPPPEVHDDLTRAESPQKEPTPEMHDDLTRAESPQEEPTPDVHDDSMLAKYPPEEPTRDVHDDSMRAECPPKEPSSKVHEDSTRAESPPKEPPPELHDDSTRADRPPKETTPKVHDDSMLAECPPKEPSSEVYDDSTRAETPPKAPPPELHDDSTRADRPPKEPTPEVHDDSMLAECPPKEPPPEVHDDSTRAESPPKEPSSEVYDDSTRAETPPKAPPPELHDDLTRSESSHNDLTRCESLYEDEDCYSLVYDSPQRGSTHEVEEDITRYKSPPIEPTHDEFFTFLLPESSRQSRTEIFFRAVAAGDAEIVLRYIQQIPDCTYWRDKNGRTIIHLAALNKNKDICDLLFQHTCISNVDELDKNGNTPLHSAVKYRSQDIGLHIMLVERGSDPYHSNLHSQTPKDLSSWGRDENILIQKAVQRRRYTDLLSESDKPLQVVKLFFCGDPSVGKTTLKKSLTKQSFLNLPGLVGAMQTLKSASPFGNTVQYIATPGIDVATEHISGAGQFSTWDCAGQLEYHITHGMFLGVENSIFIVTYDLAKDPESIQKCIKYWLSFIRAGHNPNQKTKPTVVLVATHLDKCDDHFKATRTAKKLLKQTIVKYCYYLNISSDLIMVDARVSSGEGMHCLKKVLHKLSTDIKGAKMIPALCEKIKTLKGNWGRSDYPVLSWSEFYKIVTVEIDPLIKEDTVKLATSYLHDMGEIYYAELTDKEHQVILKTNWLSYNVIGAAFAKEDFPAKFEKLPQRHVYTRSELKSFFKSSADVDLLISLLQHVGLLYKFGERMYVIPGKLPDMLDKVSWRKEEVFQEYYGRRIECKEDVDMFAPDVFPCIQTRVMEEFDMLDASASISKTTLKFSHESTEGMVQFAPDKRAINIACRCSGESDREQCHVTLSRVTRLVQLELLKRSPGTQVRTMFLSPRSLKSHDDLSDVWHYTEEDLQKGETEGSNVVKHRSTANTEKISAILCHGYDPLFLQWFGAACSTQWVPHKVKRQLYRCLGQQGPKRDDYRSLGEVLAISTKDVNEFELEKRVEAIISRYCEREKKRLSLGNLYNILSHPGLVDNTNALEVLKELLSGYNIKVPCTGEVETDMPLDHIAWRATLRHCWDSLRADIIPSSLHYPFLNENDEETTCFTERNQGTRKANDFLLGCLLEQHGRCEDFLKSLTDAGLDRLTKMLTNTYQQMRKDLPIANVVQKKYLLAWRTVMEKKWMTFRSSLVPHIILPELSFLSEEDKEDIIDLETRLSVPAAADIIHTKIRDTSDPTHYRELVKGLRKCGFHDLAESLCDELEMVLRNDEFKFVSVHIHAIYRLKT